MVQSAILNEHKVVLVGSSGFIADFSDYTNGNPATDVINMENWNRVVFVVAKGAGATGQATITVESCDDAVPTNTQAIPFYWRKSVGGTDTFSEWALASSTGITTSAGADQVYEITVTDDMLYGDHKYIRLQFTETNSDACNGAVVAILFQPRQADPTNSPTVLV